MHDSATSGDSDRDATLKRLQRLFYWKGMTKAVQQYIRQCVVCRSCKYDNSPHPGLLQPLPIPKEAWVDVSMDFIEGLPRSYGKEIIFMVVDRFSKYVHLTTLAHPSLQWM